MWLLIAVLLAAAPSFACFCTNTANACSETGGSMVVFLGRVLADSGEGLGTGPARVLIEEGLLNAPDGLKEVEVETSAGTSCYRRLRQDERYIIFAGKRPGVPGRLSIGPCSNTVLLRGNEHILDELRNKVRGGPSRLVGTVLKSTGAYSKDGGVAGAVVVARSAANRYEALSNASGAYEMRGMVPDRYRIEIVKSGFAADQEFNQRWSGRSILNKATNKIEPDEEARRTVVVEEKSCEVWDLAMWPHGRISGVVTSAAGEPLKGITVQSFAFDRRGERESRPLRTAQTRLTIEGATCSNPSRAAST